MMTIHPTHRKFAASAALSAAAGILLGIVLDNAFLHAAKSPLYSAGINYPADQEIQRSHFECPFDHWNAPTEPFEGSPRGDDPQLHLVFYQEPLAPTGSKLADTPHPHF
jgi:hypothetical protein